MMPTLPTDFTASIAACVSMRSASVGILPRAAAALLHARLVVAGLEILLGAVEHLRRDRDIAQRGVAVGNVADVVVDAENLLDDDDGAARLAFGIGAIGAERMPSLAVSVIV